MSISTAGVFCHLKLKIKSSKADETGETVLSALLFCHIVFGLVLNVFSYDQGGKSLKYMRFDSV